MHRAKKRKRASVERRELTRQIQCFLPSLRGDRDILLAALTYILIHTLSYFYHTLLPVSHCTFFLTYTYFQSLAETRLTAATLSFLLLTFRFTLSKTGGDGNRFRRLSSSSSSPRGK